MYRSEKSTRSLSLSRLQHVVAADLYFSDRVLGPLIPLMVTRRTGITIFVMLIQVIVAASLAAAVVLVLRNLELV